MSLNLRDLTFADHSDVNSLCETVWGGNDYVPERFPKWIDDPNSFPIGLFVENELVALANLECISNKDAAWVKGLRVKEQFRKQGYGSMLLNHLFAKAKEEGKCALKYATSSRNEASIKLAEKLGFGLVNSVGYFRLEPPFPPHPKPSQSIQPIEIDELRLAEVLELDESLLESSTFPVAWEFYGTDLESLARLNQKAKIRAVIDESGRIVTLFVMAIRTRNEMKTMTYTIYSSNRTIFVDVFSRILDELTEEGANRAAFFLGPNVEEWVKYSVDIPSEFENRRFLLYELTV